MLLAEYVIKVPTLFLWPNVLDEIDKDFLPSLSVITIAVFTKMILFQHLIIHIQTISNA